MAWVSVSMGQCLAPCAQLCMNGLCKCTCEYCVTKYGPASGTLHVCKYGWQVRVWVASIPRNVKVAAGGKWGGGALGTCLLASA